MPPEKTAWELFSLWEFISHPMRYLPPTVDLWLNEWGNWINQFIQANPKFCMFLSGTGMSWFTWFVMHTPWKWDDKWPEWVKRKWFKKTEEKDEEEIKP